MQRGTTAIQASGLLLGIGGLAGGAAILGLGIPDRQAGIDDPGRAAEAVPTVRASRRGVLRGAGRPSSVVPPAGGEL